MVFILIERSQSITLEEYWFCKSIEVTDYTNLSMVINCVEEATEFLSTDNAVYIVVKLSSLVTGDKINYEINDPAGTSIISEEEIIPTDFGILYAYKQVNIASENRQPGEYSVTMYINDDEALIDTFTITEDPSVTCTGQGLYCCPSPNVCTSPATAICSLGTCCANEEQCKPFSLTGLFSRTEVTNCEAEGLNECGEVIKLYDYNIHSAISPEQTAVIQFRETDVDCYEKTDVAIAYYDEVAEAWVKRNTYIEEGAAEGTYEVSALISYIGYLALVRSDECVPSVCTYGGYRITPISGYVNSGEEITFELCGLVNNCELSENGVCNVQCAGSDPDCGTCTSQEGDCCKISYDDICDLDCGPGVDPDCCDKSKVLCCPADLAKSGSSGCDNNCGILDLSCSDCTNTGGDCCTGNIDGVCDPDCPTTNLYVDPDCCDPSIDVNCCNPTCDGVCDTNCIAGLDPDCYYPCFQCDGDGVCEANENTQTCPQDCPIIIDPGVGGGIGDITI